MKRMLPILKKITLLFLLTIGLGLEGSAQVCSINQNDGVSPAGVTPTGLPGIPSGISYYIVNRVGLNSNCEGLISKSTLDQFISTECGYFEYIDENGNFVGETDLNATPNTNTFTFNGTHVAGASNDRTGRFFLVNFYEMQSQEMPEAQIAIFVQDVVDTAQPVINNPNVIADRNVLCTASTNPSATGELRPNIDVTDICTGVDRVFSQDTRNTLVRGQAYLGGKRCATIAREWRAVDGAGNSVTTVQNINVYDTQAPTFTGGTLASPDQNGGNIYSYSSVAVSCDNLGAVMDGFSPSATDNCGLIGGVEEVEPIGGEEVNRGEFQFLASFYNYTIRRTWQAVDNCGFVSFATRDYQVTDNEAPEIMPVSIYEGTTPPILSADNITSGIGNVKEYDVAPPIDIAGCDPNLVFDVQFTDNCAANNFISVEYVVFELESNGQFAFIERGTYSPATGVTLESERNYRVQLEYRDPVGNLSILRINVNTLPPNSEIDCSTIPYNVTVGTDGEAVVNFEDVITAQIASQAISNVCNPTDVFLEMKRADATIWNRGSRSINTGNTQTQVLLDIINDPSVTPSVAINCEDAGQIVPIEGRIVNASNNNVISECTVFVNALPAPDGSIVASVSSLPATGPTMPNGRIDIQNIAVQPSTTQSYLINWTGPTSGSQIANTPNAIISNLLPGVYSVTITGTMSCGAVTYEVVVDQTQPMVLQIDCPVNLTPGQQASVFVRASSGFENISSFKFAISVTGVNGLTIARNNFNQLTPAPSTINLTSQTIEVNWEAALGASTTTSDNFYVFNIDVPGSLPTGGTAIISIDATSDATYGATQRLSNSNIVPIDINTQSAICTVPVGVETGNNNVSVGGNIEFMNTGLPLPGVTVTLMQNGVQAAQTTTDANGNYTFTDVPQGSSVMVVPSRSGDDLAFDAFDLLQLSRFQTQQSNEIDDFYQLIAGNVSGDATLNTLDALFMSRTLVNTNNPLFDLNEWIFVSADQSFDFGTTTDIPPLESDFSNANLFNSTSNVDFIGVKLGDVNESAVSASVDNSLESRSSIPFRIDNKELKQGQTQMITISSGADLDLNGFLTEFEIDANLIQIESFEATNQLASIGDFEAGSGSEEKFAVLWISPEETIVNEGTPLFHLEVKALNEGIDLAEAISLSTEYNRSVAFSTTKASDVVLEFGVTAVELEKGEQFIVYSSVPNPFDLFTSIDFSIPNTQKVTLEVFDLSGASLITKSGEYHKGYNKFIVRKEELPASGIYYYRLSTATDQYMDKFMLMD